MATICLEIICLYLCDISEKKFLEFFFKRLKLNDSGSYAAAFPYLSPCGREKNYIRCDDLPVVYRESQ